jgi:hypothetical protein
MLPKLSFGIMTLQNLPYASMVERWRQLDALGFDSVWLGDHFVDPFRPNEPWYDGWTLLALATHTTRIRIRTLVSSITLRNPALLAKEAMPVDHIIFYWLTQEGHPVVADRGLQGVTITDHATLERVAIDAIPALRDES